MRSSRFVVWFLSATCLFGAKKPVTIDAVVNESSLRHGPIVWAPDGKRFISSERGTLSLFEVESGREREVLALDQLEKAAVPTPQPAAFDWTNRRVDESDLQWFADGRRLLVSAAGDLFIVDTDKRTFDPLTQTPEAERDPKLSPDNRYISFRRGPDLYAIEVASKHVTRLTTNGSETLLNGQLDWVYPEELNLDTAHWWSPDSRSIAYLQFDVSGEPVFPQVSLLNPRALLEPERYPQPGDPNADVRLGVVPVAGGETKWMDLGEPRGWLLARVVWSPTSRSILAERLPRAQNKLDLLLADTATGEAHTVLHEEDATWINAFNSEPVFLGKGDSFLWASERSGFRHLYVYGVDGKLRRQLTQGNWEVGDIAGVDEDHGRIYFTSTEDSPVQRQLYSVALDGSGKQRLSKAAGTHSISFGPRGLFYVDEHSSVAAPPQSAICKADGSEVRPYHPAKAPDELEMLTPEIVQVKASDGTVLYARLIKPAGFQAGKKYAAVVTVYGGPGVQTVTDSWSGANWDQVLAQQGFVVWQLDNRGSTGRGHAFESAIYHNMGAQELKDQQDGIRALIAMGFVDPARIGLYGWSYGGYMTLYTITHTSGLIKAAIAGAPVTNWRNYDTIYTERYMGLPGENPGGYDASSPALHAAGLQGTKLLIIHNQEDDNVHFQNSVQMAAALEKAGKQFSMLVYPQRTHHVSGPEWKQLLEATTAFFEENLKP